MKKLFFLAIFLFASLFVVAQTVVAQKVEKPGGVMVEMTTNYGKMLLLLYDDTPLHRDNFIKLAVEGTFDGLLFHRVIGKFMIQGGDPDSRGAKPGKMLGEGTLGYNIPAEFRPNLFHKRGALCAGRERYSAGRGAFLGFDKRNAIYYTIRTVTAPGVRL